MRSLPRLLTAAAASAALLMTTAVSATAQSQKLKDKRADVVQFDFIGDNFDEVGTLLDRADSLASGIDATRATVKHSKKSLKVTLTFAQLTKAEVDAFALVRVKGKGKGPHFYINSDGRKKVTVYDAKTFDELCSGKQSVKAGKNGTVTFSVKRSCLGKPKAIKVQVGASRWIDFDDENFTIYQDVISSSKVRTPATTKWLKAS